MLVRNDFASLTNPTYTTPGYVRGRSALSIMYFWTGTLAATATLWASNYEKPDESNDNDWVQVTDVALTNPTSGGGKFAVPVQNTVHKWYRLKFAGPSGAGNLIVLVEHVPSSTRV